MPPRGPRRGACLLALALALSAAPAFAASAKPNLLYVVVDDLRPQLSGAYGQTAMITPNVARLQAQGVTFTRAYAQVSVCSPSRTSFLTGMRPDQTRLWTIGPYFRKTAGADRGDRIVTLPQALKAAGWNATGAGKVWHPGVSSGGDPAWGGGCVGGNDMPRSWSHAAPRGVDPRLLFWECDSWSNNTAQSPAASGLRGGRGCVTTPACVACFRQENSLPACEWAGEGGGAARHCPAAAAAGRRGS